MALALSSAKTIIFSACSWPANHDGKPFWSVCPTPVLRAKGTLSFKGQDFGGEQVPTTEEETHPSYLANY